MIEITKKQMYFLRKIKSSGNAYEWHNRIYANDSCAYALNGHRVHFVGNPVGDSVDVYNFDFVSSYRHRWSFWHWHRDTVIFA